MILALMKSLSLSTTFLATPLPARGRIDVIETNSAKASKAEKSYVDLNLFPFPKVYNDPGALSPPGKDDGQLPDDCGYDLVYVHDTSISLPSFQTALQLTRKGGVIVLHGTVRDGT